jgi:hypothetical protein
LRADETTDNSADDRASGIRAAAAIDHLDAIDVSQLVTLSLYGC